MMLLSKFIADFDNFNPPLLALVAHYSRLSEKATRQVQVLVTKIKNDYSKIKKNIPEYSQRYY